MRQVPLALAPEPLGSFDDFLPGPNADVVAQLKSRVPPATPLFLWGPSGSGKTHLLRALALACQCAGARVGWFDAAHPPQGAFDPAWVLVLIDDAPLLDARAQHAAFALLVDAQGHGVPWAAAGDRPPVDLALRDDLRTRLAWGPVHGLQPLDEALTRAVLRREADRRGILLSDEVLAYLMSRFARDLKFLMRLLDRLDEFALAMGRAVTVPLLRTMLAQEPGVLEEGP
jgi:DnaA family protein